MGLASYMDSILCKGGIVAATAPGDVDDLADEVLGCEEAFPHVLSRDGVLAIILPD